MAWASKIVFLAELIAVLMGSLHVQEAAAESTCICGCQESLQRLAAQTYKVLQLLVPLRPAKPCA